MSRRFGKMAIDTSNLPSWLGASQVYSKIQRIVTALNSQEHQIHPPAGRGKKRHFNPSAEANEIIKAMNRGDEEALKDYLWRYRNLL